MVYWVKRIWFPGWLLLTSCSAHEVDHQACYADAELTHADRKRVECRAVKWDDCPARPAILKSLREAYRRCP